MIVGSEADRLPMPNSSAISRLSLIAWRRDCGRPLRAVSKNIRWQPLLQGLSIGGSPNGVCSQETHGELTVTVDTSDRSLGVGWLTKWALTASVTKANTLRPCWRHVSITLSSVSTKRLPEVLGVPKDSFRQKQPRPPTHPGGGRPRAVAKDHAMNAHWHCSSDRHSRAAETSTDGRRHFKCAGTGRPACLGA